ncbi:MAG: MBL fold metallo-hydrolase [Boseongicola sp.]|nr:MBL fold metallo-hydrolase [Boseongicola sp.]
MHPLRGTFYWLSVLIALPPLLIAEVNKTEEIADGVYFHEGDLGRRGHSNNGWIEFKHYVVVIDGNFPSGAKYVLPKIKAASEQPIRFVFDTHHHGDHAYGNYEWYVAGATAIAHVNVIEEMKRYETGQYGNAPGRWEQAVIDRPDVAASEFLPPSILFEDKLILDDGTQRVEFHHFGTSHTHGDGFAWLPKQKILFTGDACVNGPYNYVGDGNTREWIETLEKAKALGARLICPGHGPVAGPELLDHQQNYFIQLRSEVKKLLTKGVAAADMGSHSPVIKAQLRRIEGLNKYIGTWFDGQLSKIVEELQAEEPAAAK